MNGHLPTRQVHLDFHTSEWVPGIGTRFSRENFQQALQLGHVNSVTVFAKCHHSWCYYPSKVGRMHPGLDFDLTGAMVAAAHEIGVKAPLYLTVGWSANDAEAHPEWLARNRDGSLQLSSFDPAASPGAPKPIVSWKILCLAGGLAEHVVALTREVCERYPVVDGIFYDMCFLGDKCFCDACRSGMVANGLDPDSDADAEAYYILMRRKFMSDCADALRERHPEACFFFNGGAEPYRPQYHELQSHFEMEDLPTTWGGYDKMPLRAKYFLRSSQDFLGMTGKFHTMWGEFGGFKHPEALRYEVAAMMANGARCSVGDQMHPCGEMDFDTYRTIGHAYAYAETIEPYCFGTEETARLGILLSGDDNSDEGLARMLMERQIDYDIVLREEPLDRFEAVILPDSVRLDERMADRLRVFAQQGGGILMTGTSGLDEAHARFLIDAGVASEGPSAFSCDYVTAGRDLQAGIVSSPFLFYEGAWRTTVVDGEVLAGVREPYFERTYGRYCSHQNTPNRLEAASHPAAVRKGNVVWLAHPVCRMYFAHGAQYHRDYLLNALRLIHRNPVLSVAMPSAGRARFVRQPAQKRGVLHLLYASPIQRGRTLVIEDMPPLYDVPVELRMNSPVGCVRLVPQGEAIPFTQEGGLVRLTVPVVRCHQAIVFEDRPN